jgi:putative nucleotidyltransferase with HDIG domain
VDSQQNINKINDYIAKIPSLPVTVTKVLEICNSPNTSPVDLNKVISLDPVLMARVLKLINSAYYGLSQKVTSLVRAIIMLGLNTVKNLAISTAVLGNLGGKELFQALNMQGFWRHSLGVGVISKLIAKKIGIDKNFLEEYFIAGLLHDIGKIPLNNILSETYIEAMSASDRAQISLHTAEKDIIGLDHTDAGLLIGQKWNLGQDILDTIQYHHSLDLYKGNDTKILHTVHVANYWANLLEIGFSGNRYSAKIETALLASLGIDWKFLDEVEDIADSEIQKAKIFLKISE